MEVSCQHNLVDLRIVEEFHEQVAQWINSVIRGSQYEYAGQVVDHVIEYFLVLRLGQFNERFPESHTMSFTPQNYVLQFLVSLSHQCGSHHRNSFSFGSQRVDKQFHYSATLLEYAEFRCVSEDDLQSQYSDLFVLIPHCFIDPLLEVKFNELQIQIFEQFWEKFRESDLSSLGFSISKYSFEDIKQLVFKRASVESYKDGNESAGCYFGHGWLSCFSEFQGYIFQSSYEFVFVDMRFQNDFHNRNQLFICSKLKTVQTLKAGLKNELSLNCSQLIIFFQQQRPKCLGDQLLVLRLL